MHLTEVQRRRPHLDERFEVRDDWLVDIGHSQIGACLRVVDDCSHARLNPAERRLFPNYVPRLKLCRRIARNHLHSCSFEVLLTLTTCRRKPLEREPTLEWPVTERGGGDIPGVLQRRSHLGDRRTDLSGVERQGV
jgi:hypothetical protein